MRMNMHVTYILSQLIERQNGQLINRKQKQSLREDD